MSDSPSLDLDKLLQDPSPEHGRFHWLVEFKFLVPDITPDEISELLKSEGLKTEDVDPWIYDEVVVRGGPDGREALDKALAYIEDPTVYQLQVQQLHILSLNLLSVAEVV